MKLIVISSPEYFTGEREIVCSLFESGLEIFHVNKPALSAQEIQNYIRHFPEKYRNRIFLHSDFPKFHSLPLTPPVLSGIYFISPVFDSISKKEYKSKFNLEELQNSPLLRREDRGEAIALGGIDEDKILPCLELGFAGIAVCGAIWQSNNPLEKFKRLKALCQRKGLVY